MSTAFGLAATAVVLQQLLLKGFGELKVSEAMGGTTANVSCISPSRFDVDDGKSRLNIFLYNQTRNTGFCNEYLASRDARGERIKNAVLGLDLHFLLTAHGIADFHAEILLGAAMQILNDSPFLERQSIRDVLKPSADIPAALGLSGIADQLELLKIVGLNHNTDEVSRIWSALQVPGRPGAAYMVSALLIEAQNPTRSPLPVRSRQLYTVPLRTPRIDGVESGVDALAPILPSDPLLLRGANLKTRNVGVQINGIDLSAGIVEVENEWLKLGLLPTPPELRAGVCTAQIVQPIAMGDPPTPHRGVESNLAAFVLNPEATFVVVAGTSRVDASGVTLRSGSVTVTSKPAIGTRQRAQLLLNEKDPPSNRAARAYTFQATDGNGVLAPNDSTDTLSIAYRDVAAGAYLARLQVDAGMSPLRLENGRLSKPEVAL